MVAPNNPTGHEDAQGKGIFLEHSPGATLCRSGFPLTLEVQQLSGWRQEPCVTSVVLCDCFLTFKLGCLV